MPLDEMSLILDEAGPEGPGARKSHFQNPFQRPFDLGLFSSTLSRLLAGGVPLLQALQVLREAFTRSGEKEILKKIGEEIRQGRSFSETLAEETLFFPSFFVQVVRTGEVSGTLDVVLRRMSE